MEVIIDRIEGSFAVAELPNGQTADLPLVFVPGVQEGDVVSIIIDHDKTHKRELYIKQLMDQVFPPQN